MGFRQFGPHILTLQEQANAVRACEMLCVAQQLRQGGAGPGGYDIERLFRRVFHAPVFDCNGQRQAVRGGRQKGAFFRGGLMQRDPNPIAQQFRQHQARKSRSGAQIGQACGCWGHKWGELG